MLPIVRPTSGQTYCSVPALTSCAATLTQECEQDVSPGMAIARLEALGSPQVEVASIEVAIRITSLCCFDLRAGRELARAQSYQVHVETSEVVRKV